MMTKPEDLIAATASGEGIAPLAAPSWATIIAIAALMWAAGSIALLCAIAVDKLLLALGAHIPWHTITILSTLLRTLLLVAVFAAGSRAAGISFRQSWGAAPRLQNAIVLITGLTGIFAISYMASAFFFASKESGGIVQTLINMWDLPILSYPQRNTFFGWLGDGKSFGFALSTLIIAPFVEELLGCGLIYLALKKRIPLLAALVLNSAFFALRHYGFDSFTAAIPGVSGLFASPPPVAFLWLFLRGLIITAAYERSGALWVPIFLHYFWNLTGYYFMWVLPK
jgi:membrane protease YdiL (CAAX protease family)